MSAIAGAVLLAGGTIVVGGVGAVAATFGAIYGFFMGLWSNRMALGILLVLALLAMVWIPWQSTIQRKVEQAARNAGFIYHDTFRPTLITLSDFYNTLICWWDLGWHLTQNFWTNILFDTIRDCGGFNSIITPATGVIQAALIDVFAYQILNVTNLISTPVNITPIIYPMTQLIDAIEFTLCCSCEDLCPIFTTFLDTLKDNNFWCAIQNAINSIFFLVRPILDFLIRLASSQPVIRPNFQLLGNFLCNTFYCTVAFLSALLQRMNDNIFTIISIFQITDITCGVAVTGCLISRAFVAVLDLIFHADLLIKWPNNYWLVSPLGLRSSMRLFLNTIAEPTPVVIIETDFPEYALDLVGTYEGSPLQYDYQTHLLLTETGVPDRMQTCGCNTLRALLSAFSLSLDPCPILDGLTQIVDAVFFVFDAGVNIFRFRKWMRRMDFAFAEGLFQPKGGAISIVPRILAVFNANMARTMEVFAAFCADLLRYTLEAIRVPMLGQDTFGVFIPEPLYTRPHIRCGRSQLFPDQAAMSCSLRSFVDIYIPYLTANASAALCAYEDDISEYIFFGLKLGVICCTASYAAIFINAAVRLIVYLFQNIAFGDPDLFFRGPSELIQQLSETLVISLARALACGCRAVAAIFRYFKINPDGSDPCTCIDLGVSSALGAAVRLAEGVIINFTRNLSINAPYFQAGTPQSPGINRTFLSQLNPLGRPVGALKGDVELLIESVVLLLTCPLAIVAMIPGFASVIDIWRVTLSAIFSAFARAFLSTLLAAASANGAFFLDFGAGLVRDTFWRRTSKFVALWAAVLDLIQTPIVWGNTGAAPDVSDRPTGDPNRYPVNQEFGSNRYSADIYIPTFANGRIGQVLTLGDAFELTLNLLFGTFGAQDIGTFLMCPFRRIARLLIGLIILIFELVSRILFTLFNPSQMKANVLDWMFGCTVPVQARAVPLQSNIIGSLDPNTIQPATCADTDGPIVTVVQIFRCPCDWIGAIKVSVIGCLCGTVAYQPTLQGAVGSAGLLTSLVEFIATAALVAMVIFRDGFHFQISIRNQVINPLMIATGRALYGSTCIIIQVFGDYCSKVKWAALITTVAEVLYAVPVFIAGIISRDMQENIIIPSDLYHGGQTNFAFTGWNDFRSYGLNGAGNCNPAVTPKACGHRNADVPDRTAPGADGLFNFAAGTLYSVTNLLIFSLDFINCAIVSTLDRIGLNTKFISATLGGALEIAKVAQSVFFSLLWFVWQFFKLLIWFLTNNFGKFDIIKIAKAGIKVATTLIRALAGLFSDSHDYYTGDGADDEIVETCAERQSDGDFPATQEGFLACYAEESGGATGFPSKFQYIQPSLNSRGARGGAEKNDNTNEDTPAPRARRAAGGPLPPRAVLPSHLPDSWVNNLLGATSFNEWSCRHGNLAQCICPWEPEVAGDTGLCTPGEVLDAAEEQQLLELAVAKVWTGRSMCDALMRDASRRGWMDVSVTERDELAQCLDQRAAGVRTVHIMCGGLPPGAMCAWDASLWYQPERLSSFYTRAKAAELGARVQPVYPGGPPRYVAEQQARANIAAFRNATELPGSAWDAWYRKLERDLTGGRNSTAYVHILPGTLERKGSRAEPAVEEPKNATAHPPAPHGWHWGTLTLDFPPPPTPAEKEAAEREHAAFLTQVRANLTNGVYDEDTSAWLLGQADMPLDIALRPWGEALLARTVTRGSPDIRVRPGVAFTDPDWREGEEHHEATHRTRGPAHRMTRAQMEATMWSTYDPHKLSGLGRMPGRRMIRYELPGWDGPQHWNSPAPQRTPQDNLSTWNRRIGQRMVSIRETAERAGVVGPIASETHEAHPELQAAILRGAQAVDFLMYGWLTGAFAAHWDTRDISEEAKSEGRHARAFDTPRTAVEDTWSGLSDAYDSYHYYNGLLRSSGGYALHDLPGVLWNVTKAGGNWMRAGAWGGATVEDAPPAEEGSSHRHGRGEPLDPNTGMPKWRRNGRTVEEEEAAEVENPSETINITEVYGIRPMWWRGPEYVATWWAGLPAGISRRVSEMVDTANGKHASKEVVVFQRREREAETRARADEGAWTRHSKRFLIGGTCLVFDRILTDFLTAVTYCQTTTPLPPIMARGEPVTGSGDQLMALYSQGGSAARLGLYSDADNGAWWRPPSHEALWQGGVARRDPDILLDQTTWVPQAPVVATLPVANRSQLTTYYDVPGGQTVNLRIKWRADGQWDVWGGGGGGYVAGEPAAQGAIARWEDGQRVHEQRPPDPYGRGGRWDPYGSHEPLPRHTWAPDGEAAPDNGGYGGWSGAGSSRYAGGARNTHPARGLSPGRSYGVMWSALSLLLRLVDWVASKIGFINGLHLFSFFETALGGTGTFLTNPNLDEDAGPIGLKGWIDIVTRCRFPRSLNCSHGVGAVTAFKRMFWWLVGGFIVAQFLPGSALVTMFGGYGAAIFFAIYAWRWSPMCAMRFELPFCLVNDLEGILSFIFRRCYDDLLRPYMTTDGILCRPPEEELEIIDCTAVGVSNGFVSAAVLVRLFSGKAVGMFAGLLESLVIIGPHGAGNQAVRYIRAISNSIVRSGDELRRQQNFCAVNSFIDIASVALLVTLGAMVILLVWGILVPWGTFGVTVYTSVTGVAAAFSDTSTVGAEAQAGYLVPYMP